MGKRRSDGATERRSDEGLEESEVRSPESRVGLGLSADGGLDALDSGLRTMDSGPPACADSLFTANPSSAQIGILPR